MSDHDALSPRERHVRGALAWFAAAALLIPARMLLDGLMPSVENTVVDEVPAMVLVVASGVFAVAGVVRLVQALRAPRMRSAYTARELTEQDVAAAKARLDAARQSHVALRGPDDTARRVVERYHTPV